MEDKMIGKGTFTTAYMWGTDEVLLKSTDHIKEVMAHGWFPESPLFPVVRPTDTQGEYLMEYYPRTRGLKGPLDAEEYQLYKELRFLFSEFKVPSNKHDLYHKWYKTFEAYPFSHTDAEDIRGALLEALDACSNYGTDVNFEISPRNVAVKDGKLILLDCFFLTTQLNQVRGSK